jgi:hypothetical protein
MTNPKIPNDVLSTGKQLAAHGSMDLTDEEITQVMEVMGRLTIKYSHKVASEKNLAELADEAETKMFELGILAKVDPTPTLEGKPPIVDLIGKVGHPGFSGAYDYEREMWLVSKAKNERNEYYYGEKEQLNPKSKAAKRKAQ